MDLADIEIVVQWRVTCDLNTLWQRFGRAGRGPGTQAIAILFAESKYFDEAKNKAAQSEAQRASERVEKATEQERGKRKRQNSASHEPSKRAKVTHDPPDENANTEQHTSSPDEGPSSSQEELSIFEQLRVGYAAAMPTDSQQRGRVKRTYDVQAQLVGPEIDALINASTREYQCYRVPIMAYYENDRRGQLISCMWFHVLI